MQPRDDIADVFAFTRTWHDRAWCVGDLPGVLSATVVYAPMGRGILGISSQSGNIRLISLNERVQDDPFLKHGLLCHEGGHLLTRSSGHDFSFPGWQPDKAELPAWLGAGLLCVSDKQVRCHHRGRMSVAEIAEDNAVPEQLVAIGICLRETQLGLESSAPETPLEDSITAWLIEMQRRVRLLVA